MYSIRSQHPIINKPKTREAVTRFLLQLIVLFLPLFGSFSLHAETLTIGLREGWHPSDMTKTMVRVKQAAASIGHQLNFKTFPANRSIYLASLGELDGDFYRHSVIEPLYPSLSRVDVPLGKFDYMVWVHKDSPCMQNLQELKKLKPVGTRGAKFFSERVYPLSQVGFEEVESIILVHEMLERGRADYTVHSPSITQRYSNAYDIPFKRCLDEPLFSMNLYLYLHESKRALIPALEQALLHSAVSSVTVKVE